MSIPDHALLQTIGQAMVSAAPAGWRSLTLHVSAAGRLTHTQLVPDMPNGTESPDVTIDFAGRRAAAELRKTMYQDGTGTWYNAHIIVDSESKIKFEFDYDNAPLGGLADESEPDAAGWASEDLLRKDQELFPRSAENLPDWHPARSA